MSFWQRLQRGFDRGVDFFPITWLGSFVFEFGMLALFYYGWKRLDLILLVVGAVAVGMATLALLFVLMGAAIVYRTLRRQGVGGALTTECGVPSTTGFSVPSLWYLPMVDVRWKWIAPEVDIEIRVEEGRRIEVVTPRRRGVYDHVVRRVDVFDAFGIARITFTTSEERPVTFIPSVGALRRVDVARSLASGEDRPHPGGQPEGERADLRRYVPGDPVRFILWKVFAKTRELIVRTPEQAISPARQTLAYLVSGQADEPAAGAARVAIETGALGAGWCMGADGAAHAATDNKAALDIVTRSSRCDRDAGGAGLATFVRQHASVPGARIVVFVPARPGPWVDRVLLAAQSVATQGKTCGIEFVVCTDGFSPEPAKSRLRKWLRVDRRRDDGDQVSAETVRELVATLGALRGNVLLVDRTYGRVFPASQCFARWTPKTAATGTSAAASSEAVG